MRDVLDAVLSRAVGHLLRVQRADGAWVDYRLPVGRSDQWVSAFVACALARVPERLRDAALEASCDRAAAWLLAGRSYGRGWGFNDHVGPDADSTAYALQALRAAGRRAPAADRDFLAEHWLEEGGFRTYAREDAWGRDHPDVTVAAYRALSGTERRRRLPLLLSYLRSMREETGGWPAYWWRSGHYTTYHALDLLAEMGVSEEEAFGPAPRGRFEARTVSELAYVLGIVHHRGERPETLARLLRILASLQRPDGGWPGGADLGVTEPDCREPWRDPRRTYYVDHEGILTTASVVRVLARPADGPRPPGATT